MSKEPIKYTEEFHAQRLLEMLEKKNPCACCPKIDIFYYLTSESHELHIDYDYIHPCGICKDFVQSYGDCPCTYLGKKEANFTQECANIFVLFFNSYRSIINQ